MKFDDPEDPAEFKPSRIASYYRDDESKVGEYDLTFGHRVFDPGNLWTDYPHSGILNTTVFLLRYPTTPTNRNRARARWSYYHFLGLDVEKSASRTTDPDALADTNNPTMNNSACTVCHSVMDPVAGAYQNYGEKGEYRDEWGGKDSLDHFYKSPPDGGYTPYQPGDSWYRDMREPGFDGRVAPDASNSVKWLAEQIVADDRFSEATVKFWWPAIMGMEIAPPPEDENDSGFEGMLLASSAQSAEVERLAEAFRTGIAGGTPYNLKDLLVEIVLSPWFRADTVSDNDPVRAVALRNAGIERLLTPEELAWKTEAITGYRWQRDVGNWSHHTFSGLTSDGGYRLFYGGIDSDGITIRATDITPLMAAVAQSHAVESSCPIVQRELLLWSEENRRLFQNIDKSVSPVSEISAMTVIEAESWEERETNSWAVSLGAGPKTVRVGFLNDYYNPDTQDNRDLIVDEVIVRDRNGVIIERIELENLDPKECNRPHWNEMRARLDGYGLYCGTEEEGWLEVPVSISVDGEYRIEIIAYQLAAGDESAMLGIVVESDIDSSRGAMVIRRKLVELHEKLLGVTVTVDSPDVEAAFELFVEVWDRQRGVLDDPWEDNIKCSVDDRLFFKEIADDVLTNDDKYSNYEFDWDRVDEILGKAGWWGREGRYHPVIRAWTVALTYLMMDYRYLYY